MSFDQENNPFLIANETLSFQKSLPKTFKALWEIRHHESGRLLGTFHNRQLLEMALALVHPWELWDLLFIRAGRFDNLRKERVRIVAGTYKKHAFCDALMHRIDMVEQSPNALADREDSSDMRLVAGFYIISKDYGTAPNRIGLAYLITQEATQAHQLYAKVLELERKRATRYLMEDKFFLAEPVKAEKGPVTLVYGSHTKRFGTAPVGSVQDLLNLTRLPWMKTFPALAPLETIKLVKACAPAATVKVASASFDSKSIAQVLFRGYELFFAAERAPWAGNIASFAVGNKGSLREPYQVAIAFRMSPATQGLDVIEVMAYFASCCLSEATIEIPCVNDGSGIVFEVPSSPEIGALSERIIQACGTMVITSDVIFEIYHAVPVDPLPDGKFDRRTFTVFSDMSWEYHTNSMGDPLRVFDEPFLSMLNLDHRVPVLAILSEHIVQGGEHHRELYYIPRVMVPSMIKSLTALIAQIKASEAGSCFLGALFWFESWEDETVGHGLSAETHVHLALFSDSSATYEKQQNILFSLGIGQDTLVCDSSFRAPPIASAKGCPLRVAWSVTVDGARRITKNFQDFHALQYHVNWMQRSALLSTTLAADLGKTFDDDASSKVYIITPFYEIGQLLFKSTFDSRDSLFLADHFNPLLHAYKIQFSQVPDSDLIRVCYFLLPSADPVLFLEAMTTRKVCHSFVTMFSGPPQHTLTLRLQISSWQKDYWEPRELLADRSVWEKRLRLSTGCSSVSIRSIFELAPKKRIYPAVQVLIPENKVPDMVIRTLELLYLHHRVWPGKYHRVVLQRVPGKKREKTLVPGAPAMWEYIWVMEDTHLPGEPGFKQLNQVLVHLLVACGCKPPVCLAGSYNFASASFEALIVINVDVDDGLRLIDQKCSYSTASPQGPVCGQADGALLPCARDPAAEIELALEAATIPNLDTTDPQLATAIPQLAATIPQLEVTIPQLEMTTPQLDLNEAPQDTYAGVPATVVRRKQPVKERRVLMRPANLLNYPT